MQDSLPLWIERSLKKGYTDYVSIGELVNRIHQYPLTQSRISNFVNTHVGSLQLVHFTSKKFSGKIYCIGSLATIMINNNKPLKEKASIFIHECAHGIYGAGGNHLENVLCKYHQHFFKNNYLYSVKLFDNARKLFE